jgi:uncharacterized protein YukE
MGAIAEGDLGQRVEVRYHGAFGRLASAVNRTADQLAGIVRGIQQSADAINTAAGEIASGNTDLSRRTESQAANLEETAASMEELTSTVRQNADSARQADQLAKTAGEVAATAAVVEDVVTTMASIREASAHRRHHRRDRRHRVPDQHPRAERGGGSRTRRRAGARLCRGGLEVRSLASVRPARPRKSSSSSTCRPNASSGSTLVASAGTTMHEWSVPCSG